MEWWLFVVVIAAILVVGVISYFVDKKRREALAAVGAEHGFVVLDDDQLEELLGYWQRDSWPFDVGHGRRFTFGMRGTWDGRQALICDYQYKTTSGSGKNRSTTTHRVSLSAVQLPVALPTLRVRPEGVFSRAWGAMTDSDIDLEWEEFNRDFVVESPDRAFATAVLHPRMMEHLVALGDIAFSLEGRDAYMCEPGSHVPENATSKLEVLDGILDRLPPHVLDRGPSS